MRKSTVRTVAATFLAVCTVLVPMRARAGVELDSFSYASDAQAARAWQAKEHSPPVRASGGARGLIFSCPFRQELERVYWDRAVTLDLSRYTSFEFDFSCHGPGAIRTLYVYFKSGNGWYAWSAPLRDAGRQSLLMNKKEFATEGRPAGWHKIEAIRISPFRGSAADASLTAYSLRAHTDSILLVQGTASAADAAEKSAARRAARRISRWLKARNITHGLLHDEQVTSSSLAGASVVILCYNPNLPQRELAALETFVGRGGKLIVFYSADPALARLMHFKLGAYTQSRKAGRWNSFRFTDRGTWRVPKEVFQESWNIRPVLPADSSARVIAYWFNARGKKTRDPAWVASGQGLWMTHILLEDDVRGKQDMLLGLIGRFEPAVWPRAAWQAIRRTGKIDSFRSLGEASEEIARQARRSPSRDRVKKLLDQAGKLSRQMLDHYEHKQYPQVVDSGRRLREALVEAYALAQSPRKREFRGVWDHDGLGWYPGDWDRTCGLLRESGITAIFPNIAWAGLAHYDSPLLPRSDAFRLYGDQLEKCVRAAHKRGLEVHAWKVCWNLDAAPDEFVRKMKAAGRLQQTADGRSLPWLCPSHPANRDMELAAIQEMAERYNVDGIHLDYIRYPSPDACYCTASRAAFEKWLGKKIAAWPRDVRAGGSHLKAFRRWRATEIARFVESARAKIKSVNPRIRLSAAVYGNYPQCADSLGQDWGAWLRDGLVDFVCPMNYTEDPVRFSAMTRKQLRPRANRKRVYPGLGVTASESRLTADQVIEQILALRDLHATGFMLFKLDRTLKDETLPALGMGVTRVTD